MTATPLLWVLLSVTVTVTVTAAPPTSQDIQPLPYTDASLSAAGESPRLTRAAPSPALSWLQLVAEYARTPAAASSSDDDWFPRPIPITLPLGRGADNKQVSVPVLVVPVPVPSHHAPATQCASTVAAGDGASSTGVSGAGASGVGASANFNVAGGADDAGASYVPPRPRVPIRGGGQSSRVVTGAVRYSGEEPSVPHLDYVVSSQQLVELFQAQVAEHPELPPAVIPDYSAGEEGGEPEETEDAGEARFTRGTRLVRLRRYHQPGAYTSPDSTPFDSQSPPVPRLERSLMLRGELTVPRAGYTEPYTVWWDAAGGGARVDLHGGATSTYRLMLADGRTQFVEMTVDRSGGRDVRRCATSTPRAAAAADRALPAIPDMTGFTFGGYVDSEWGRVERWVQTIASGSGEAGAVRGEALTYRHEVVVARSPDNYTTTPLKYTVNVDSTVLGPNCDGYVHRYVELRDHHHDPSLLNFDIGESCEEVELTEQRQRLEPLREFTMLHRDHRYDTEYQQFKTGHRRRYWDDTEEAVRKNLLMQHSRFINSGNRQGATFNLEVNHLGDRLDAELGVLRGVREDAEGYPAQRFPHSREQLAALRGRLPRRFDWRQHGAVTHVRNQGSCSSCWAFAVAGAVEGALFVATRQLVALSEQCLVDCAHPYGGHGCGGTWPSAAYDYIKDRGLPALNEYTPYSEKVLKCRSSQIPPVTHISSHVNVTKNSVQALKVAIRRHAPTVVIIDASPKSFIFYKKGVLQDERCAKNKAEHAVLAVGWGEHRRQSHFILKNSWSEKWGDGGYVRLQAPSNTCGVLSRPSYPNLERQNVDKLPSTLTDVS